MVLCSSREDSASSTGADDESRILHLVNSTCSSDRDDDGVGGDDGNLNNVIDVPMCWQLHPSCANDDPPVYTNITYPIKIDPPNVPRHNPTGVFRTTAAPWPETWRQKRIVLCVEAADSCADVYFNGKHVGSGSDAKLPLEIDVTEHGSFQTNNRIAIVVRRWSAGSFLEDQDHWHLSGLTREVWIRAKPKLARIEDVNFTATATGVLAACVHVGVDDDERWNSLEVDVALRPFHAVGGAPHTDAFMSPSAAFVPPKELVRLSCKQAEIMPNRRDGMYRCRHRFAVDDANDDSSVRLWSPEAPHLYVLTVTLRHQGEHVLESEAFCVGFRTVRIAREPCAMLTLNGQPVEIRGVNRHEHCPHRGKAIRPRDAWDDVRLLADYGFNAVRTSHYPNHGALYDACDFYGLLVVDEANLETHGMDLSTSGSDISPLPWVSSRAPARHAKLSRHFLAHDDRWIAHYMERAARMVARDRNHCSIVMWSLGNESGSGPTIAAMYAYVRHQEFADAYAAHRRPIAYEGAGVNDGAGTVSDIAFPMYWSSEMCEKYCEFKRLMSSRGDDVDDEDEADVWDDASFHDGRDSKAKPLIQCEYSHAMGNSNGNFSDYWDTVRGRSGRRQQFPAFQGGFIWDMIDQGLLADSHRKHIDDVEGDCGSNAPDAYRAWVAQFDDDLRWHRSNAARRPKLAATSQPPPYRYGGDFKPHDEAYPHDANFNINGIFFPDRVPKPACFEIRHCMQPLHFVWSDGALSDVVVLPYTSFVSPADELDFTWQLYDDDGVVLTAEMPFGAVSSATKQQEGEWNYRFAPFALDASHMKRAASTVASIATVVCRARRRENAGSCMMPPRDAVAASRSRSTCPVVAFDRLVVRKAEPVPRAVRAISTTLSEFSLDEGRSWQKSFQVAGTGASTGCVIWRVQSPTASMHVTIRLDEGARLEQCTWICGGGRTKRVIFASLAPCFYRAPTDNDEGGETSGPRGSFASRWRDFGLDCAELRCTGAQPAGRDAVAVAMAVMCGGCRVGRIALHVALDCNACTISTAYVLTPEVAWPPVARVGVCAEIVSKGCDTVRWHGDGPHECYPDRRESALPGIYDIPLNAMATPYIKPSESGARTNVRQLTLVSDTSSPHITFSPLHGEPFACASARRASMSRVMHTSHADELAVEDSVYVHLDSMHMGLGGDTSWAPHTKKPWLISLRKNVGVAFGVCISNKEV